MSISSLPRMFVSEREGWSDMVRMHPSVKSLLLYLVVPMSLLPAVMYAFAELAYPGAIFVRLEPSLSLGEALIVGAAFFLIEVLMVALMAVFIQQMGESVGIVPPYEHAFSLAAVAPVPLWLSSLALFVPSLWLNVAVVAVAWVGCVALIRHGVRPLLRMRDEQQARQMANKVTFIGVVAWLLLMVMLAFLLSVVLGLR